LLVNQNTLLFLSLIGCNKKRGRESLKIKKIFFLLFSLTILNGCIETTAFLGPAISVGTTGNVYQASLSYSTNRIIHSATGKTPIEHVTNFLDPNDEFDGNLNLIVADNINHAKESLKINKEPFKDIYVHALVRDEKEQKMSKSKKNVIDPLDLINKYSVDALRFTLLSMASSGRDVKESLKINKENLSSSKIEKKSEKVVNLNLEDQFILF